MISVYMTSPSNMKTYILRQAIPYLKIYVAFSNVKSFRMLLVLQCVVIHCTIFHQNMCSFWAETLCLSRKKRNREQERRLEIACALLRLG